MPSELLKQAMAGSDIELTEVTWLCQSSQLLAEDIITLKNKAKNIAKCNQHEKYLIACLYTFGAPNVPKDLTSAKKILSDLIDMNDSSYAKNLAIFHTDDYDKSQNTDHYQDCQKLQRDAATKQQNPLAILNYAKGKIASFGYMLAEESQISIPLTKDGKVDIDKKVEKRSNIQMTMGFHAATPIRETESRGKTSESGFYHSVHREFFRPDELPNTKNNLNVLKQVLELLAISHQTLYRTHLREDLTQLIKNFKGDLTRLQKVLQSNEPVQIGVSSPLVSKTLTEFFGKEPMKWVAKFWLALVDYYKNINQRIAACHALQEVTKLNPKYKKEWLSFLGANEFKSEDVKNYIKFFLESSIIINTRLEKNVASSEELLNAYLNQSVELKNCELIYEHCKYLLTPAEAEKINSQLDDGKTYYEILKNKLISLDIIPSEQDKKETIKFRS